MLRNVCDSPVYVADQEEYYVDIILDNLVQLYQGSQDEDILNLTASILGICVEETQSRLHTYDYN